MKKSRFSEEQVAYALCQAEAGTPQHSACVIELPSIRFRQPE